MDDDNQSGRIQVSFDYYGASVPIAIDTGACIPVHAVWMVD